MLGLVTRRFHINRTLFKVVPFRLADIGEGIKECEVLQWYIKQGDSINEFDKLCEVQSDKAAVEITSRYTGKVMKLYKQPGEIVQVGSVLVDIDTNESASEKSEQEPKVKDAGVKNLEVADNLSLFAKSDESSKQYVDYNQYDKVITTPAVRRIAREQKIDLCLVTPTGKNGRILKSDIEEYLKSPNANSSTSPIDSVEGSELIIQSAIQKSMFKSMTTSNSIPRFGYSDLLPMSNLESLRHSVNNNVKQKLSYMPFLIKAFGTACLDYPTINASFRNNEFYSNSSVNIGIAMDTPNGLMVPNIKDIQLKSIVEIHLEMQELQLKAKSNKLNPSDFKNTTFTLSNIGTIGGLFVFPVVPFGTTTIVGLGKSHFIQNPDSSKPEIIKAMPLSLAADHRIVDGATSAKFIQSAKSLLMGGLVAHLK
eukprot:NODE_401_length_9344_cov_0.427366.p1 type:complete len:424 gc:universal NODE_401_length_9344_cov_0.427366:2691-3962(+)